jgi:hypothetical protein
MNISQTFVILISINDMEKDVMSKNVVQGKGQI